MFGKVTWRVVTWHKNPGRSLFDPRPPQKEFTLEHNESAEQGKASDSAGAYIEAEPKFRLFIIIIQPRPSS